MMNWIRGWIETLRIMFLNPELYRFLISEKDLDDFIEVGPPE